MHFEFLSMHFLNNTQSHKPKTYKQNRKRKEFQYQGEKSLIRFQTECAQLCNVQKMLKRVFRCASGVCHEQGEKKIRSSYVINAHRE